MYRITITRIETVTKKGGQKWEVIDKTDAGKEIFGYTPTILVEQQESQEVYSQSVQNLDLVRVIDAVNGK